jgi:hypothetical protein
VLHNIEQDIRAAFNLKIKARVLIDSRLPDVQRFIILLRAEGRMTNIGGKIRNLLPEGALDTNRGSFIAAMEAFRSSGGQLMRVSSQPFAFSPCGCG